MAFSSTGCVCVCARVRQCDRCWTAIVMEFNAHWGALPGPNCNVREALNGGQFTQAPSHDESSGGSSVTGVHGGVTGKY